MSVSMLDLFGTNLHARKFSSPLAQVVISRQRIQRERIPVEVILQIENTGGTGTRKLGLIPGAIGVLMGHQPFYSTLDRRIVGSRNCQQPNQSPRGLRSGALPPALPRRG